MSASQLVNTLASTIEGIKQNPPAGKAEFRARTELIRDVHCKAAIRQFSLTTDEPTSLGGQDTAPNPVELVLAALGTCQEVIYSAYAAFFGIELESLKIDVKGDLDLQGLFGLDPEANAGFNQVVYDVYIKSSASPEAIRKLVETVNAHCPVLDTLERPISVRGQVHLVDKNHVVPLPSV